MKLELSAGSIVQVIGGSGQGLSRLAEELHREREGVGVVGQDAIAHVTFLRETVAEEVAFGLEQRGVRREEMEGRVDRMLRLVGLSELAEADPAALSGGQTRRLAVAAVAVLEPETLVLDDPFAGLDHASADRLVTLCHSLPRTAVVVLGNRPHPSLSGEVLPLSPAPLAHPGLQLPEPVGRGGTVLDLGPVTGRRGAGRRRWWQSHRPDSREFTVGPVHVQVVPGEVLWLRGDNGSGKTTLLRALAGLDGAPGTRVPVSLMLQRAGDQVVDTTVRGFVGPAAEPLGLDPDAHPLDLGATDLRLAQFLAVAGPGRPVMLADEPDVGLDHRGRGVMHGLIAERLRAGTALVITCHDEAFMAEIARYSRVSCLNLDQ
ncbi:ATP-binding cassette domain-containing protein [Corynebacterium comes]|uniref:Energy-coupling factor transporter ATP-binding protein EcfA2 n=1 Tax=Corynebacterium comes TaxID=2675218 RepID=A0A6B8VW15_9CORY|nr:ATP-binding cassette domain-containing protein [Corynebacterium comes]QGU04301.1 Energy-coupling factor transporter ATP-binding protein EcfA2 [Corynebacterium comes]